MLLFWRVQFIYFVEYHSVWFDAPSQIQDVYPSIYLWRGWQAGGGGRKYKANDKRSCALVYFFNDAANLTVADAKLDMCSTHQSSPLLNCYFSFYNFLANFGESLPFFVGFALR